ncbi:MAG TPA: hypothetical protein DCR62_01005 [Acholeplasmatales bacterium]|jgi:membrane protein|nr:hypothetical protein [Acholeplasmatales bacterium]
MIISFFNSYRIYEVPNRFSYQHILLLLIDVIYIFLLIFLLRKKSNQLKRKILLGLTIACCLIFAGRMFFGWEQSRIFNNGSKVTLLPIELCNINIIITLIALVINKKFLNNYMYYVTMIGGLIPLLVFPDCHMITQGNNLFHYMFLDFWFIHTNLVAIPIAMIAWGFFQPEKKQIPKVILTLVGIYLFAFLSSIILRNFDSFQTANYMYSLRHNNLPILKQLYSIIPIPFVYGLPLALPISILFYLMALPFELKKGTQNYV